MLDFKELNKDGNDFELLVRELLYNLGLEVYWSGKGIDGGKDLLCIERYTSNFKNTSKRWLMQCKHKAHSQKAVGLSDLDGIIESCTEHNATGYLLVCSTYPSSSVVKRLEKIQDTSGIITQFWDYRFLEKELLKPQNWNIANIFFPNSMKKSGWMISSIEPCFWYANYKGNVFYIATRVGMSCNFALPEIERRIKYIKSLEMPAGHILRIRAFHFDDKYTNHTMYVDFLIPKFDDEPDNEYYLESTVHKIEKYTIIDGISYRLDIQSYRYNAASDSFNVDSYEYYNQYIKDFERGTSLSDSRQFIYSNQDDVTQLTINNAENAFNELIVTFKKIEFITVLKSINSRIEFIDQFTEHFSQNFLVSDAGYDVDNFFSVQIRFVCDRFDLLNELLAVIPQSAAEFFQLSKNYIFSPGEGLDEEDDIYTLKISLNTSLFTTKLQYRKELNIYLLEIKKAIDDYLDL